MTKQSQTISTKQILLTINSATCVLKKSTPPPTTYIHILRYPLREIARDWVVKQLNNLNQNKATGPDELLASSSYQAHGVCYSFVYFIRNQIVHIDLMCNIILLKLINWIKTMTCKPHYKNVSVPTYYACNLFPWNKLKTFIMTSTDTVVDQIPRMFCHCIGCEMAVERIALTTNASIFCSSRSVT